MLRLALRGPHHALCDLSHSMSVDTAVSPRCQLLTRAIPLQSQFPARTRHEMYCHDSLIIMKNPTSLEGRVAGEIPLTFLPGMRVMNGRISVVSGIPSAHI